MNKKTSQLICRGAPGPALRRGRRPSGLASVLAMLYLTLISTLAVGFFVATTLSAQISKNESGLSRAQAAADGGMQFVRYELGAVVLAPSVQTQDYLSNVATQLNTLIGGTKNMNGNAVQVTNGAIYIPSATGWTTIDGNVGTEFRATITQSGANLVVQTVGGGSGVTASRLIQVQFQKAPRAGAVLDYGVASQGTVATAGSTFIQGATDPTKGSVLSADMASGTPITIGGTAVSGDLSVVNPGATIYVANGSSVGGTSDPTKILAHEHYGAPAPTFPWIDTSMFTKYATNAYTPNQTSYTNIVIPPNTNPSFAAGTTINGVLYIQSPNVVSFKGNATVNGLIVTDPSGSYSASANQINFGGNLYVNPVSSLDPNNPNFAGLTTLTGSFMLAPNFAVSMTGNFGTINGSLLAGTVHLSGNAAGTIQGSVIAMYDSSASGSSSAVYLAGNSTITISSQGTSQYPTGMNFGNNFTPLPGTYLEVTQ